MACIIRKFSDIIFGFYFTSVLFSMENGFEFDILLFIEVRQIFSVLFFNALTFASDKFGWSSSRTDEVLLPVLKQLNKDEVGAFQASKSYVNVPSILI